MLADDQTAFGEKSLEAWAATKLYEALEELETSSRPELGSGAA
ncbi:MAG: hypothetical protein WB762_23345 [Candidatus Sulfotelmatobacter sp.]